MGRVLFILLLGLYFAIAYKVMGRIKPVWGKALFATIALLFPFMLAADAIHGLRKLRQLCAEEGGLKIHRTVEQVKGFRDYGYAREFLVKEIGFQFVEGRGDDEKSVDRIIRQSDESIVHEKNVTPISQYAIKFESEDIGGGFERNEFRVTDTRTNEILARYVDYRYSGGWAESAGFRSAGACDLGSYSDELITKTLKPIPAEALARAAEQGQKKEAIRPPAGPIAAMKPGTSFRDCEECPEMVVIPAGSFLMGSPESEPERDLDEGPQHKVRIARQFAVGRYEVTFDEWDACIREGGCDYKPDHEGWGRGKRPVINVSWKLAKQYVDWVSRKAGRKYRLLTEAEWEYAARAGTTTAFHFGDSPSPKQANYGTEDAYGTRVTGALWRTVPVGSYPPNGFGLYDMHGNVSELVEDCWNDNYSSAPSDGRAWLSGDCERRVRRGGSWRFDPSVLRSASRTRASTNSISETTGFRVARTD